MWSFFLASYTPGCDSVKIQRIILYLLTTVVGFIYVYMTWIYAPPEVNLGELIRIFFQHVAPAWVAYLAFGVTLFCGVMYLWKHDLRFDVAGGASIQLGLLFTTITLFSGMIWANATWGTPWNWDPRETTTLILWIAYACLLVYRASVADRDVRAQFGSLFGIVAFPAVVLSYVSIHIWNTLHPIVVTPGGLNMGFEHGMTLMVSVIAITLVYFVLLDLTYRLDSVKEKVMEYRMTRS
ncbi:MAG: cytochrome c biogenesis protein CcsA [Candidatus Thorarchaeota archaeon]|nr:cytochrome c biogenesis protein CcsA [Candidatus Thorarchaeota archaeon]MCK5238969.1 cytochrome c biogenesis protein CcsA [Candidatus Thorarchaeota archaeon]